MQTRLHLWRVVTGLAISGLLLAACGTTAKHTSGPSTSSPTRLAFTKAGTPNLQGLNIPVIDDGPASSVGDANFYDLYLILKRWGATTSYITGAHGTAPPAVLSGSEVVVNAPIDQDVDAGLVVFGPNMARVDEVLLATNSIHSIRALRGKRVSIDDLTSPAATVLVGALKQGGLTEKAVTIVYSGSPGGSVGQLLSGQVDAAIIPSENVPLFSASKWHVIGTGATLLPTFADSFMAATPAWLLANPAAAEAVDLAWLSSARLFNTDPTAWIKIATQYTNNAGNKSYYLGQYNILKRVNGWPSKASTFTSAVFSQNYAVENSLGAIVGPMGHRPLSEMVDTRPWQAAIKVYDAKPSAFGPRG